MEVNVWGSLVGNCHPAPYPAASTSDVWGGNDNSVNSVWHQSHGKPVSLKQTGNPGNNSEESNASFVHMQSEDNSTDVVDMGKRIEAVHMPDTTSLGSGIREAEPSYAVTQGQGAICVKLKKHITLKEDSSVLLPSVQYTEATERKQRGCVKNGDAKDVLELLNEQPAQTDQGEACKGVICDSQVLCHENGVYDGGKQYDAIPDKISKGAFGEAVMCQDRRSLKTVIRKTVSKVEKNEILVPFMFTDFKGIPKIFGVIQRGHTTEIFQEFAGVSLEKLINTKYGAYLRHPGVLLCLAFQGFKTLEKLHSRGIQHLDIKPQNICVDLGQTVPFLKLIDFGSSQMPGQMTTSGVTFEYLSPEACRALLQMAKGGSLQRLEDGTDVWAMGLSLLYCLLGFHPTVYHYTGAADYSCVTPSEKNEERARCVVKISQMTDAHVADLLNLSCALREPIIRPEVKVLKAVLSNALRVNPAHRWSAGQAAAFIAGNGDPKSGITEPAVSTSGCPVAGASAVTLRVQTAQNVQERRPLPRSVLVCPRVLLRHGAGPSPRSQNTAQHTQPCKRKCDGEWSMHGGKVLRQ